jgi:energy-converting hydrogenase Eha subunit A
VQALLNRPAAERQREHRYRFSQSVVFGLPVIALQWFGHRLGGDEAAIWIAVFQALLAGWVIYVAATGMLVEAMRLRRLTLDAAAAGVAVALYLASILATLMLLLDAPGWVTALYHWSVLVLIAWTGTQWWRLARLG